MKPNRPSVLVTGASGMLGSVLFKRLSVSYDPIGVSRSGRNSMLVGDLSKEDQVRSLIQSTKPSLVLHCAAYSDVDGCERDPKSAYEANALSVKHLSRYCGESAAALVHISTDYVFDGEKRSPYTESDPVNPINIYGMSKLLGEYYALQCTAPAVVVRTSWLYGHENPRTFTEAIFQKLKAEKNLSVLADQINCPTSVEDLSGALLKICRRLSDPDTANSLRGIYHYCNRGETTRFEMTTVMRDLLGWSDREIAVADTSAIKGRLAIRPAYSAMRCEKYERAFRDAIRPWKESFAEYVKGWS